METKTKKIVLAGLFAALACVATMIIKIPTPFNGYINLGDSVVLLCGWFLGPLAGFLAAGIGSALADHLSGYTIYVLPTFIIKGLMALAAYALFHALQKSDKSLSLSRLVSALAAELIMVVGYFIFAVIKYMIFVAPGTALGASIVASFVKIPGDIVQAVAGLVIGFLLAKIFEKSKIAI